MNGFGGTMHLFEESPNFYELLQLDKSATGSEVKKAFQKLAKELHPDKNNGKTSKKLPLWLIQLLENNGHSRNPKIG